MQCAPQCAVSFRDVVEVTPNKFKSLVQLKCLRSVAEPGEAVGLLAAQVVDRTLMGLLFVLWPSLYITL